ncbi:MAG: TolC family protein [Verrucomicrobiales bacterium]
MAAMVVGIMACGEANAQNSNPPPEAVTEAPAANVTLANNGMGLQEVVRKVLIHNEGLQSKMLDAEIARRQFKAEKGIFEPAVVGSYERVDSKRENTVEQTANLFGNSAGRTAFNERNDLFNAGVEFLSPIGSRFRVGYNMRRLRNNLNAQTTGTEYVSTAGITMTQPLLKNFGPGATLVRIRLAAINSDIAYQDYRRQLVLAISRAEAAYWDLYLTQEQDRISNESVDLATSIFNDNRARAEAGKASELEVLQAEAGRSLRMARRNDAAQRMSEAASQLATMYSSSMADTNVVIRAAEEPKVNEFAFDFYGAYKEAFEHNPDYLTRRHQALAENIRLAYAKNQRLPEVDLKGSYGLNGLGRDPEGSYEDIEHTDYPAWSVGVELRIPVTGGIKERNEYKAAKLAKEKALVGIKEIEVQMGNALNTSLLKVNNLRESVRNHQSVIDFHQQLLETQLARLEVGVLESRTVLETEEKLFEARITQLENLVQYQKALLELELVQGITLKNRNLDLSKAELQDQTERMLEAKAFAGPVVQAIKQEVQADYSMKIKNLNADEKKQGFKDRIFN